MWLVYSITSYPYEGNEEPVNKVTLDNLDVAKAFVEMHVSHPGTWKEYLVTPTRRVVVYSFTSKRTAASFTTWYVEKI